MPSRRGPRAAGSPSPFFAQPRRKGVVLPVPSLVLSALLVGCAPRPARLPMPPTEPASVLQLVQAREERITTLRARFTSDTQRAGERHSADGVLLVKKPDRFRLRMTLPFGLTIFDYLKWGDHAQLALPLEGRVVDNPAQEHDVAFSQEDLGQAFLRGPNAFPGRCAASRGDDSVIVVVCRDASGAAVRQIRIDARSAVIDDETSYADGQPHMMIRYTDYRAVDNTYLPYRITLTYPAYDVTLDIAIQRYEVNPILADDLFRPVRPWAGS